jgi:hypothetical protein
MLMKIRFPASNKIKDTVIRLYMFVNRNITVVELWCLIVL